MALALTAPPTSAVGIFELISNGDLDQAADSLSSVTTAGLRDGNLLFYASLLETDGEKSVRLMEAALNASVAVMHRETIHYRLAQYYFMVGNYERLGSLVADYLSAWESGRHRREMLRFSIIVDEHAGAYESATRQADRYLLQFGDDETGQWVTIDKARIMLENKKKIGAEKLLRRLSRGSSGPGVSQALYLLGRDAVMQKRTDDAVFYYNMLRESYPGAVGLDALIDLMADLTTSDVADNTAEKLTGTYYSVQVGVFSVKANADKQVAEFSKFDQPTDIARKKISNVSYHVVYVGRFSDYASASKFKTRLEAEFGETFQVVAR